MEFTSLVLVNNFKSSCYCSVDFTEGNNIEIIFIWLMNY